MEKGDPMVIYSGHEWFEDCEETDCPFFNEESGCMRVKAEYVLDVQEGILKKTEE